ncbi:unnamed protein product [Protopolystoma xenopodis]|uniref:mRNA capping enzyme adenylation domain-containing protein n=1 Tax=Protopolystoma xenopodis TaxID=117903 RepID=A0A448WKK2_9PLAT|nr:unnamed protein product [Protopolystoma xenopodis]
MLHLVGDSRFSRIVQSQGNDVSLDKSACSPATLKSNLKRSADAEEDEGTIIDSASSLKIARYLPPSLPAQFDTSAPGQSSSSTSKPGPFTLPPVPPGTPDFMAGIHRVTTLDQRSVESHEARELGFRLCRFGGCRYSSDGSHDLVSALAQDGDGEDEQDEDDDREESKGKQSGLTESKSSEEASVLEQRQSNALGSEDNSGQQDWSKAAPGHASLARGEFPFTVKWRKLPLHFLGSQPVSMSFDNLGLLQDKPYHVSYKADGTRYLLLIARPRRVYLIDRCNFVYRPEKLHFPTMNWVNRVKDNPPASGDEPDYLTTPGGHLIDTLLDGELCLFHEPNSPEPVPRFLIYDAITINGYPVGKFEFARRYSSIIEHVICPRNTAVQLGLFDMPAQSFSVRRKEFFPLACLKDVRVLLRKLFLLLWSFASWLFTSVSFL